MDLKKSLILSCLIMLSLAIIIAIYGIYTDNIKAQKNFVKAQDEFRNSNLEKAESLLNATPPRNIEKDYYLLKYNVQMNRNELYQAEKTCLILLKKYPKDDFINYLTSLVYYNMDDADNTEKYLKTAIELSPKNIDYKISLANLYGGIGKDQQAINIFNEVKDLNPEYEIAWASIATIYENNFEYTKALTYRKEAAKRFYNNSYDLYMLAELYNKLGDKKQAAQYYAQTIKYDFTDSTDAKSKYFDITGKPYTTAHKFKNDKIPYKNHNGLIIVNASINGKQGKFLIDTGASKSCIYSDFVKRNHLTLKSDILGIVQSANNQKNIVPVTNVAIGLGNQNFTNIQIYILPKSNEIFDGIIGNDVLSSLDFYIDKTQNIIIIKNL